MKSPRHKAVVEFYKRGSCAFTLVELMIATGVFSMSVIALVYVHIFGMRMDQWVQSKCGASASSRRGFGQLELDIRSSKTWEIGTASGSGGSVAFTPVSIGSAQSGNSVRLHLTSNTNQYILYYFNTSNTNDSVLFRLHGGDSTSSMIASNLYNSGTFPSNSLCFTAENYQGTVQTDRNHTGVIHTLLELREFQYPTTLVGSNCLYDYYKIEFKITPHVPD